ncbi:MAG TPA: hypothetical protein PKE62_12255 [Anaerolineales bacterium]|nr:hypothetical protein [Anaerolineales bacterium]
MKFNERAQQLWKQYDPSKNEGSKYFLDSIVENIRESSKVYTWSFYTTLVFASLYWLLNSGNFQEFTFFDFTINDVSLLKWAIPLIMSFVYYQGIGAFIFEIYCQVLFDNFLTQHASKIEELELEPFAYPLSFFNLERAFSRGPEPGGKVATFFGALVGISLLLLPPSIIIYFIVNNILLLGSFPSDPAKIIILILSSLVLIRSISMIGFHMTSTNQYN